jgi:hypothetical protein
LATRNDIENNRNNKCGIKEAVEKSQYEKLANDWRQVHSIIWGVPSIAIAIMTGIILAAFQSQLAGPPRIVALSLGSLLLFALTVELVKKRLLMNALSVRLQELEGQHTDKFPFTTPGLDALVNKVIQKEDNQDEKDPLFKLFKWDYARMTLTYVTFIAALAVASLAEYEFVIEFENEFVKHYKNEALGLAIGLGIGVGVIIGVSTLIIILKWKDKRTRNRKFTPAKAVQKLIDTITSMDMPKNLRRGFISPLQQALKILNDDNPSNNNAVCINLDDLLRRVNANLIEADIKITKSQAETLMCQTIIIKSRLDCPSLLPPKSGSQEMPESSKPREV